HSRHPPIHAEYTSMLPGVHRWAGQTAGRRRQARHTWSLSLGRYPCRSEWLLHLADGFLAGTGYLVARHLCWSSAGCQEYLAVVSDRCGFGDCGADVVQAEFLAG